jgi:hypothetical protein
MDSRSFLITQDLEQEFALGSLKVRKQFSRLRMKIRKS